MYIQYYKKFYNIAYSILKNSHDAEDAVSEGFLIFLEKEGSIDQEKAVNWLSVVIANEAKAHYRVKRKNIPCEFSDEMGEEEQNILFNKHADSVEELVLQKELKQQLEELLNECLNDLQSNCIRSYYFDALSYQEIAEHYDINIGTVRSNLARARIKLKEAADKEL